MNQVDMTQSDDAVLVADSLAGKREAFGQIVARYQTLICSLAYSGTGSLSQSEDLAQETFIVAWNQLASLREPHKLRAWLCGIARHHICDALKRQGREPSHAAEPLDVIRETPAHEPQPHDLTISNEEAAILWRSLERIPEIYREPLVLFYREHQSVEAVSQQLDLSEDAAKQRLSRGRKLLHEQVIAFVEGALARTNPGPAFTLAVLATLPAFTISAKAATFGVAAKGGAAVKGLTLGSLFGFWLGPALGILLGYLGYRESRKIACTPRERQLRNRLAKVMCGGGLVFCVALLSLLFMPRPFLHWDRHPMIIITLGLGITVTWCAFASVVARRFVRAFAKLREEERQLHPELFSNQPAWPVVGEVWEYRSRATLLGLPLVHCRFGNLPGQKSEPAVGWIAYGERAYGILLASGGISVGCISMGATSFGILAFGGVGFGLIAFGGLAIGAVALGGAAIGLVASGGIALGWQAAVGGMAAAREFALGGGTLAQHINDPAAREFFTHHHWLNILQPGPACLFWLAVFVPSFLHMFAWRWWRRKMAKRMKQN